MTVTENKINHIVAITNGSDIYFPKKLMARRDLADDTKLLFAVAMTDHCNMTDEDTETGYNAFEIEKGRLSFRLTAPYSKERRQAASDYAKQNIRHKRN